MYRTRGRQQKKKQVIRKNSSLREEQKWNFFRVTDSQIHAPTKRNFIFYEGGNAVYLNFKRKFLLSLDIQLSSCLEHRENKTLEVVFNSQIR